MQQLLTAQIIKPVNHTGILQTLWDGDKLDLSLGLASIDLILNLKELNPNARILLGEIHQTLILLPKFVRSLILQHSAIQAISLLYIALEALYEMSEKCLSPLYLEYSTVHEAVAFAYCSKLLPVLIDTYQQLVDILLSQGQPSSHPPIATKEEIIDKFFLPTWRSMFFLDVCVSLIDIYAHLSTQHVVELQVASMITYCVIPY